MAREIKSGIYKIFCLGDGFSYIGRSKDIEGRWTDHKNALNKGKHQSTIKRVIENISWKVENKI